MSTIDGLAGLAEKATPGEWRVEVRYNDLHLLDSNGRSMMCDMQYYPWTPDTDADWHHIAACCPANILKARDEYATLRQQLAEVTEQRDGLREALLAALKDDVECIEKGLAEWRDEAQRHARHTEAARATARIAIGHLQKVLNGCRTSDDQLRADTAARDWLASIGV